MDEIIRISVEVLDQTPVLLYVNCYETIRTLDKRLKLPENKIIVYQQICVSPTFSYKYYRIEDGSKLTVIPTHTSKTNRNVVESRSLTPPAPNLRMSFLVELKPFIQPELAKIKDQFFKKVEGTVLCNRKLMQKFKSLIERTEDSKSDEVTVCPMRAESPSTETLPTIWDSHDVYKQKKMDDSEQCTEYDS